MKILRFVLLFPLLTSCSFGHQDMSTFEFSYGDDENKVYLYQNGDLSSKPDYRLPLDKVFRSVTGEQMIDKLNANEDFFLYISQDSCSHCRNVKDTVSQFIQVPTLEGFLLQNSSINRELEVLESAFPSIRILKGLGTPAAYLFKDGTPIQLNVVDHASSPRELGEYFLGYANITHIKTYRSYDAYASSSRELTYIKESKSNFYKEIAKKIIHQQKEISIIDFDGLNDVELSKFAANIPYFSSNRVIAGHENIDANANPEAAKRLLFD